MKQNTYQMKFDDLLSEIWSSFEWLSNNEAKSRNKKYGPNEIQSKDKNSALKIFLSQFTSPLVIILIIAAAASYFLIWEKVDALIIRAVVILNALLWFFQEYKADKAIQSLKQMAWLKSKVLRNGKEVLVDARELTIWDVILLEAWDKIPADARLFEAVNLEVEEAILTWESVPVEKHITTIEQASALADIKNMVFNWTMITKGRWKAIITAIWMDTEMWKIAWMLEDAPEKTTTLEKKLDNLSKILWIAALVICLIIFVVYRQLSHLPTHRTWLLDMEPIANQTALRGELRRICAGRLQSAGKPLYELPYTQQSESTTFDAIRARRRRRGHTEPERTTEKAEHQNIRHGADIDVLSVCAIRPIYRLFV